MGIKLLVLIGTTNSAVAVNEAKYFKPRNKYNTICCSVQKMEKFRVGGFARNVRES